MIFKTWGNSKAHIKRVFGTSNEANRAGRALQKLKQALTAADYTVEFQHHAIQTWWDGKALMAM